MTSTERSVLRITGPAELLAAVPHLLGFHPEQSLVLVGLANRALVVTARLDLVDTDDGHVVSDTIAAIVRGGTNQIVGIVFTDTAPAGGDRPRSPVAAMLRGEADRAGVELMDVMTVVGDRWWSDSCRGSRCCPVEGTPMPTAPTAFTTASIVAGTVVASSREAMTRRLAPLPERHGSQVLIDEAELEVTAAILRGGLAAHDRSVKRAIFAAARAAAEGRYPSDTEVARYGAALSRIEVRDAVWLAVDDGRLSGGDVWLDLARRLPSPYDAPALFLYGWQSWRAGNGALAGMAAERAIASDPDYSAADLLLAALSRGIDPRRMPRLRLPKGGTAPATA